jgi:hypothetical protein
MNMLSRAAGMWLPVHSAAFMHVVSSASCMSRRARVRAAVDALRFQTYRTIEIHMNMLSRAAGMWLPVRSAVFMHVVLSTSCMSRHARVCAAVDAPLFQTYHTIAIYVNMLSRAAGMWLPVRSAVFMHVVLSTSCMSRHARVCAASEATWFQTFQSAEIHIDILLLAADLVLPANCAFVCACCCVCCTSWLWFRAANWHLCST